MKRLPRLTLPPPPWALAALAALFILPGLAAHDLWKSQDAIALGVVHGMATSHDLLVPRIAGERWLYDQPLYHWIALAFGTALGWVLQFHNAARLASGGFVAGAFAFIYLAAREWSAPETRRTAAAAALLLLLGSIGLLVHAHEALPELASLTAVCGALAAMAYAQRLPLAAGVSFGVALGLAFLAGTWIAPLALAVAALVACVARPEWRSRRSAIFLASALIAAVLVGGTWPLGLAAYAPSAFAEWRAIVTTREATAAANLRHFIGTASWFTWPAWPLALWTAWSLRRRLAEPRLLVPGVAVLVMVALFIAWGPPQDADLIPLLGPLSLFGTYGVFTLRRGAAGAFDWFGALTFAVFTGFVWVGYIAMLTGLPAPIARNFARIAPGYVMHFRPLVVLAAVLLALAWFYLVFFTAASPVRSVGRWAVGIVLLWGTFAALWMPWVDYQKSYRTIALELRRKLPPRVPCLAERYLGISQAAALDYHGGIRTQPYDVLKPGACRYVLVEGSPQHEADAPSPAGGLRWTKLADVGRPGDRSERYRLYRLDK